MSASSRRRAAMNLLFSVPGVGGSEEYLVRQLAGLSVTDHEWDVVVFAPRGFSERRPEIASRFEVVEAPDDCTRRPVRVALEHTWLARHTRGFDVVHHGGGTLPRSRWHRPSLLTVHDVQWTDYPHYVSAIKRTYLQRVVPSSLARATRVAVPTGFVKDTLVRHFAVDASKVGVVRHGLEPWFDTEATPEDELRDRFDLGRGPVLVFPAITHPHKNHLFLLELLAAGEGAWGDGQMKVVFAGSAGSAEQEVRDAVAQRGLEGRVVMPGRVSHADRNGLLVLAAAMVFPSQYEGFGAPLIEAMRCGTPVLCSDQGSIPEVVGDAAVVRPLERTAWVEGLGHALSHRSELTARGRVRAAMFTAAGSARDLLDQYDAVVRGAASGAASGAAGETQ